MRLPTSLLVFLAVLAGCATPGPKSEPTPKDEQSSSSGTADEPAAPPPPTSAPAPSSTPSAPPPAPITAPQSGSPAQTPDERRAAIDRRLDDSLGTFDEELRKEQERVAQERDAREAAAAGTAQTQTSETAKEGEEEGEAGTASTENPPVASTEGKTGDNPTRPGDLKSDKTAGGANTGAASGSGATAGNIPDGSDDDIVARRLRKAAEQETDPELKEKLWKEYIEYKKNAGS